MADLQTQSADTPEAAIIKVANEQGINPQHLLGLAKLETQVGRKSIKGGGRDTFNLFNIKGTGSQGSIKAEDKAEGSNDPYRAYMSYEESVRDAVAFLSNKRYAGALQAKDGVEFATILKTGGYATDAAYVAKLSGVIGASSAGATPAGVTLPSRTELSLRPPKPSKGDSLPGDGSQFLDAQLAGIRNANADSETGINQSFNVAMQNTAINSRQEQATFGSTFDVVKGDTRVNITKLLGDAMDDPGESQPTTPTWYMDNLKTIEDGRDDAEREYLRRHVIGPDTLGRAQAELQRRKDQDVEYGLAGGLNTFLAHAAVSALDPATLVGTLGVMKAFQIAGVGAMALANAGRGAAAVGSLVAENAIGAALPDALAAIAGEHRTVSDVAMTVGTGALLGAAIGGRGVVKASAAAARREAGQALMLEAANAEAVLWNRAAQEAGEGASPDQIKLAADRLQGEAIQGHVNTATRAELAPDRVRQDAQAIIESTTPEPAPTGLLPETNAPVDGAPRPDGGTVRRNIEAADGKPMQMNWSVRTRAAGGFNGHRAGDVIDSLLEIRNVDLDRNPRLREVLQFYKKSFNEGVLDSRVEFHTGDKSSNFAVARGTTQIMSFDAGSVEATADLATNLSNMSPYGIQTMVHELGHAATVAKLHAALEPDAPASLKVDAKKITELRALLQGKWDSDLKKIYSRAPNLAAQVEYGLKDDYEFVAQALSSQDMQDALTALTIKGSRNGLSAFVQRMASLVGIKAARATRTGLEETLETIETIIRTNYGEMRTTAGAPIVYSPDSIIGPAQREWTQRAYVQADRAALNGDFEFIKERTETLTRKAGNMASAALIAVGDGKNNLLLQTLSRMAEVTTGALGRKSTAALEAKAVFKPQYLGNALNEYNGFRNVWLKANGKGRFDWIKGEGQREYDKLIAQAKIAYKRDGAYPADIDPAVKAGAEALTPAYNRMRVSQIENNTTGSQALVDLNSEGYFSQQLDGARFDLLTDAQRRAAGDHVAQALKAQHGFDDGMAQLVGHRYLERARARALGDKNVDMYGIAHNEMDTIRDIVDEAGLNGSDEVAAAARNLQKSGLSQTKRRFELDMSTDLGEGKTLLDIYNTSQLQLLTNYAERTAGNVALHRAGIPGVQGYRLLRRALADAPDGQRVTPRQLEAMDQIFAEVSGTVWGEGRVASRAATNLAAFTRLRLFGGIVWNQIAETNNALGAVGLTNTLGIYRDLPKQIGDVGRIQKGQRVSGALAGFERSGGGTVGLDEYRLVAPLEASDELLDGYTNQPGIASRMLKLGEHAQSKLSFMRGFSAGQHRAVAQSILEESTRIIRGEGITGPRRAAALADMGLTPGLVKRLEASIDDWAVLTDGKLSDLDVSRIPDAADRADFVALVHRGTAQIIQGTFAGERSAWVHNDYAKALLVGRGYVLTSLEKQWSRQRMNHGATYAGGLLIAQMGLAAPLVLARLQISSVGRPDREEYLKKQTQPGAFAKQLLNYVSLSGGMSEVLNAGVALGSNALGREAAESIGGRAGQGATLGSFVPVISNADAVLKAISNPSTHGLARVLPFTSLTPVVPFLNMLKNEE